MTSKLLSKINSLYQARCWSISFALLAFIWIASVQADVFVGKNQKGNTYYTDRPESGGQRINIKPGFAYHKVERVYDGDTIELAGGDKVRLLGINTPEIENVNTRGEAGGLEAKQWLKKKLKGKKVRLEKDVTKRDKYGRLLAHVFTDSGQHINLFLVKQGFASVNIHPPNVRYADVLLEAQQQAEDNGLGIWGANEYAPKSIDVLLNAKPRGWKRLVGKPTLIEQTRRYHRLRFSNRIDVRIPNENLSFFPDLKTYLGVKLEVRGWVSRRKNTYSILVRHPSNLLVIAE